MRPKKCGELCIHCDCGRTNNKCKFIRPWNKPSKLLEIEKQKAARKPKKKTKKKRKK